jgi:hypothetical protein
MLLFGSVIAAQVKAPAQVVKKVSSRAVNSTAPDEAIIHGTVLDRSARPYPNATVRLRNLLTHAVEDTSSSNETGEFMFVVKPGLPYVVEVTDEVGRVLAVGNAITPLGGETVAAVVSTTLAGQAKSLAGMFGETAGMVLSAASSVGITALSASQAVVPASPEK